MYENIRVPPCAIYMHFRVFSLGQGTERGIIFRVAKISNILGGCLKFLIYFFLGGGGGKGQMLGPSLPGSLYKYV